MCPDHVKHKIVKPKSSWIIYVLCFVQIIAIRSELEFIALFTQLIFWVEQLNTHEIEIAELITEYFGFMGKAIAIISTELSRRSVKQNKGTDFQVTHIQLFLLRLSLEGL